MNKNAPEVAFAGFSGSGKTTFISKLIFGMTKGGARIAVIKHHHGELSVPDFLDRRKDSWKFVDAGAAYSVVVADNVSVAIETEGGIRFAVMEDETDKNGVLEVVREVPGIDLIIVEGFKNESFDYQIGISRTENGKGLPHEPSHYTAIVTDETIDAGDVPVFGLDDIDGMIVFIRENILGDV